VNFRQGVIRERIPGRWIAAIRHASGSHLARTMFGPIHLLRVRNMISIPTSRPNSDDADSGKSGIVETQRTGRFHISDSNGNGLVTLKIVMPPLKNPGSAGVFLCSDGSAFARLDGLEPLELDLDRIELRWSDALMGCEFNNLRNSRL
jgi:hypothetical protein